ncbi:hypothetical protein [Paenibacillus odorifer]|uniref:Transmembrane protein n=1 Tax=Paenibacillus odorifer TaxID=189426 RepID=A0A1R0Y849_9BACL|nr:hypothetical protein [Paenibacillus odorifer]OMD43534.1 hypothetical protein BSK52_03780 [Paenibacillus odorifer]
MSEIGTLKSSIESQVEFSKQLSVILSIIIFTLTTILAPLSFYLQQSIKTADWKHEVNMSLLKDSLGKAKEGPNLKVAQEQIVDQVQKDAQVYNDSLLELQDQHNDLLVKIITPVLVFFISLLLRYKWLSSLSGCVSAAYIEKEKMIDIENEKRDELRIQQKKKREDFFKKYDR